MRESPNSGQRRILLRVRGWHARRVVRARRGRCWRMPRRNNRLSLSVKHHAASERTDAQLRAAGDPQQRLCELLLLVARVDQRVASTMPVSPLQMPAEIALYVLSICPGAVTVMHGCFRVTCLQQTRWVFGLLAADHRRHRRRDHRRLSPARVPDCREPRAAPAAHGAPTKKGSPATRVDACYPHRYAAGDYYPSCLYRSCHRCDDRASGVHQHSRDEEPLHIEHPRVCAH